MRDTRPLLRTVEIRPPGTGRWLEPFAPHCRDVELTAGPTIGDGQDERKVVDARQKTRSVRRKAFFSVFSYGILCAKFAGLFSPSL